VVVVVVVIITFWRVLTINKMASAQIQNNFIFSLH